jgi:hypothetical protein
MSIEKVPQGTFSLRRAIYSLRGVVRYAPPELRQDPGRPLAINISPLYGEELLRELWSHDTNEARASDRQGGHNF